MKTHNISSGSYGTAARRQRPRGILAMLAGLAALTSPVVNFTENFDGAVSGDLLGGHPPGPA